MTPLIVAATPIGNPLDASARLKEAIASADLIAAEDSRKFARLAADLEVRYSGKVLSFFEANEGARIEGLIERIIAGEKFYWFQMLVFLQLAILDIVLLVNVLIEI